jgi:hypothetical protein
MTVNIRAKWPFHPGGMRSVMLRAAKLVAKKTRKKSKRKAKP